MGDKEHEEPWGQLVSTSDLCSDPVQIGKEKFVIGRATSADLCLGGNRLVSGSHCHITRDADGKVWLQDTSTNGTLINQKTKLVKEKTEIHHGDEIHLVFRKAEPKTNVSYLFQDLATLAQEEMEATLDYSTDLSATDPIEPDETIAATMDILEDEPEKPEKRTQTPKSKAMGEPPTKRLKRITTFEDAVMSNSSQESGAGDAAAVASRKSKRTLSKEASQSSSGSNKSKSGLSQSETADKSITSKVLPTPEVQEKEETKAKEEERDDFEDTLMCIICQEILHNCISLQPCMHSFCAGCYSDWMARSNECPSCRMKVERINKNHIVNNLVEAYLRAHSEKKRSEEDIKDLEAKNKITKDMLYPKKAKPMMFDDDEADEEDNEDEVESIVDSDENSGSGSDDGGITPAPFGSHLNVHAPVFIPGFGFGMQNIRPTRTICRECPTNQASDGGSLFAKVTKAIGDAAQAFMGKPATGHAAEAGPSTGKDEGDHLVADPVDHVTEWQKQMPMERRNRMVEKVFQSFTSIDTAAKKPKALVKLAVQVEKEIFETAIQDAEYYRLLADKMYSYQQQLAERRKQRAAGNNSQTKDALDTVLDIESGNYTDPDEDAVASTSDEGGTHSDAADKPLPPRKIYVCTPDQVHALCQCCLQPMPDRRHAAFADASIPPQQCKLCFRNFCHAYWGCRKPGCNGCIGRLKDLNFNQQSMDNIILDNLFESKVFTDYIRQEKLTVKNILDVCCDKLAANEYTLFSVMPGTPITPDTALCYACGLRCFKDLAYHYRKQIPQNDLTAAVTSRPDCYWGKNCRTQKCKPIHAARFNHICEQTRYT